MDRAKREATVTITGIVTKSREVKMRFARADDGRPSKVIIEGIDETSDPQMTIERGDEDGPDTVVITGICLRRCLDEPERMQPTDIEHHALSMARLALHDEAQLETARREIEARKARRPTVIHVDAPPGA